MINWQLSKQASADHYHLTVPQAQVSTHRGWVFFGSYPLTNYQSQMIMIAGSSLFFFQGFISNILCLCHYGPVLLGFCFQTGLGSENSASFFKSTGGEDLILPWSRVGHPLRPIFILWLIKVWQVSLCGKIIQHLESSLLWQLKLTEFWLNLWCF